MNKLFSKLFLTIFAFFTYSIVNAQADFTKKEITGTNHFAVLSNNTKHASTLINETLLLKQLTNCNNNFGFKFINSYGDDLKFEHKKFNVYFKNIEVKGMDFVIHEKDNAIQYLNGTFENIELNTTPLLNTNSIIAKLLLSKPVSKNLTNPVNKGLCIIKNEGVKNSVYELAYKITVNENSADAKNIYVNANTGNIITYENLACTSNAPGTAYTFYSGARNFTTDLQGSQYRLRELRNGVTIKTLNANHSTDENAITSNATDFWDNDNIWNLGEHGFDLYAHDAHWGMEKTYEYWLNRHNRNSINNAGMDITGYIHVGSNMDQAYWSKIYNKMYFGDGGSIFRCLTSLDVCAHELGHGICQFTSNLSTTSSSESAALNEGFSDIWGASVEAYAAPEKQRWLIGEELTIEFPYYLRSMSNPPSGAFSPSSDTYGDNNWNNISDEHYRSGVLNKWYFLLSDGGCGTNSNGNSYNVVGITINKAEIIAYRTEQLLNSNANYASARTMSIQAAQEIYGANSFEVKSVIKAWYAVGVGADYIGGDYYLISGSDVICTNTSETYTLNFALCNGSVSWSTDNSQVTVVPSPSGTSAVISSNNLMAGSFILTATVNGVPFNKTISVGPPLFGGYYNNGIANNQPLAYYDPNAPSTINKLCVGYNNYSATATPAGGTYVSWTLDNSPPYGVSWSQTGQAVYFSFNSSNTPVVIYKCTVSNKCGTVINRFAFQQSNCNTTGGDPCQRIFPYSLSPNPSATKQVKVSVDPNFAPPINCAKALEQYNSSNGFTISQVNIYNSLGVLVKSEKANRVKVISLNLNNLLAGTYLVEIIDGTFKEKKYLILQ